MDKEIGGFTDPADKCLTDEPMDKRTDKQTPNRGTDQYQTDGQIYAQVTDRCLADRETWKDGHERLNDG